MNTLQGASNWGQQPLSKGSLKRSTESRHKIHQATSMYVTLDTVPDPTASPRACCREAETITLARVAGIWYYWIGLDWIGLDWFGLD